MSREEKEELVNKEFDDLCAKCKEAGLDDAGIRQQARAFTGSRSASKQKGLVSSFLVYSLLVAATCGVLYFDATYDWLSAHARLATIQVRTVLVHVCCDVFQQKQEPPNTARR